MDRPDEVSVETLALAQSEHDQVPLRYEQATWALARAVLDVDFRPLDPAGRRLGRESPKAEHDAAENECKSRQLCAWFLVRWEQRLA